MQNVPAEFRTSATKVIEGEADARPESEKVFFPARMEMVGKPGIYDAPA